MIDFEDRMPAPPLTWGERALMVIAGAGSLYGLVAPLVTLWDLLA